MTKVVEFSNGVSFYYASLSDYGYSITVEDTIGGTTQTYREPSRHLLRRSRKPRLPSVAAQAAWAAAPGRVRPGPAPPERSGRDRAGERYSSHTLLQELKLSRQMIRHSAWR